MITGLRVAENGDFFICTLEGFIEQYSADGAYKRSYTPVTSPDMQIHSFVTWGDTLAVFQGSRLICYDTQAGEQTDAALSILTVRTFGTLLMLLSQNRLIRLPNIQIQIIFHEEVIIQFTQQNLRINGLCQMVVHAGLFAFFHIFT